MVIKMEDKIRLKNVIEKKKKNFVIKSNKKQRVEFSRKNMIKQLTRVMLNLITPAIV